MEVVGLIILAVVVLDPGMLRGIFTPKRAATGAAGQPGPSPTGGLGTNTYNGGPGPVASGGSPPPSGGGGGANSGGWMGLVGQGVGALGGLLGSLGVTGNHATGSPPGSQPDQFDSASRGGNTATGATQGDASWANNNSDPGPSSTDDTGALWGSGATGDQGPSWEYAGDTGGSSTDAGTMGDTDWASGGI